jgi:hypothetical protein
MVDCRDGAQWRCIAARFLCVRKQVLPMTRRVAREPRFSTGSQQCGSPRQAEDGDDYTTLIGDTPGEKPENINRFL